MVTAETPIPFVELSNCYSDLITIFNLLDKSLAADQLSSLKDQQCTLGNRRQWYASLLAVGEGYAPQPCEEVPLHSGLGY